MGFDGGTRNIELTPGNSGSGTDGIVIINDGNGNDVMQFNGVASAVNYFVATNSATTGALKIAAAGTDTNIDINLLPKGTGVLTVTGTTNYEANITDDDDIPNKKYVDDAISSGAVSSAHSSAYIPTIGNTLGTTNSAETIPANAIVVRVVVYVSSAYNTGVELEIGILGNTNYFVDTSAVDLQSGGVYVVDLFQPIGGSPQDVYYTLVGGTGGTGASTFIIEYRNQ